MNPSASVAIACLLIFPVVVTAQMSTIRGVGADERLDQPSRFAHAPVSVFVQLIVPRNAIETLSGSYSFDDLDDRLAALEGSTVLLGLEGMPASTEEESRWQDYVLAVAERYRDQVQGYILGRTDGNAPERNVETYSYLLKLAAVQIRTVDLDAVLFEGDARPREPEWLESLYEEEVAPYFDGIAVTANDELGPIVETVTRYDPSARVVVMGVSLVDEPNESIRDALIETFSNLGQGSVATMFSGSDEVIASLVATADGLSDLFAGDVVALDKNTTALDIGNVDGIHHELFFNATTEAVFLVYWPEVPAGAHPDLDVRLQSFVTDAPELHDPGGARTLPVQNFNYDVEDNVASVRVPVLDRPLILEYPAPASGATVTASVGLQVSEIIARHQQAQTRQDTLVDNYFTSVRDEIHFRPSAVDSFDVLMESRFYSDRQGSEWEELSFSLNGVRWGSDRPAFPLLQPEKVLSLPLDLQLDRNYEYELNGPGNARRARVLCRTFRAVRESLVVRGARLDRRREFRQAQSPNRANRAFGARGIECRSLYLREPR